MKFGQEGRHHRLIVLNILSTDRAVLLLLSLCPSTTSEMDNIGNVIESMIHILPVDEKMIVGKFLCQTVSIMWLWFLFDDSETKYAAKRSSSRWLGPQHAKNDCSNDVILKVSLLYIGDEQKHLCWRHLSTCHKRTTSAWEPVSLEYFRLWSCDTI